MRPSSEVVDDLLALMTELWDALEAEGKSLKGRILEANATDRSLVSVCTYTGDKETITRKRARST